MGVGPCLTPLPPDASEDASTGGSPDAPVLPCLSMVPPDADVDPDADMGDTARLEEPSPDSDRKAVLARLEARGVLPEDVARRLIPDGEEEA